MSDVTRPLILVAEDDRNILMSLEFLLSEAGYEVATASDGASAWNRILGSPPELAILDIMLPTLDGLEICKRMRADATLADTRVLMLSARGRDTEIAEGLARGADAYMTKPFATQELLTRVKTLLAR